MDKLALIFAATVWSMPAVAGETWVTLHGEQPDALLPDNSGFSGDLTGASEADYAAIVKGAFAEIYGPKVVARMFEANAFGASDSAMAITEQDGRYRVIAAASTQWLWQYTATGREQAKAYHIKLKADYHDVRIKRCSTEIEPKLAAAVADVWRRMLRKVQRADFVTPPIDAPWVYFSAPDGNRTLAGAIWVPFNKPQVSALSDIAFALEEYCWTKDAAALAQARTGTQTLTAMLASEKTR